MPFNFECQRTLSQNGASFILRPRIFLPVAILCYLAASFLALQGTLRETNGRSDLVSGDTGHYLDIARTFAAGDFTMAYVRNRPHRQPLYPLLLSPVYRWGEGGLFALAAVNIGLAALALGLIYIGISWLTHRRWIAVLICGFYASNDFLFAQTTRHLLTEPLHILLMVGVIFAMWCYLDRGRPVALLGAAALTGLDYLARPNGLFVMASLLAVLLGADICRFIFSRLPRLSNREALRNVAIYAGALLVFVVVSSPSWIPREMYFGNPVHHGYLSNYLWVDTYKQGHVGQKFAIYGWRDYARTHTMGDAAKRAVEGIWRVGIAIPVQVEGRLPLLFLLALGGVALTAIRGPANPRILAAFGFIQLLPLMWTNLSNPTVRVPYAATFPFELLFAAIALSAAADTEFLRRIYFTAAGRITGRGSPSMTTLSSAEACTALEGNPC